MNPGILGIGTIIQYILYAIFWLTVLLAVGGAVMVRQARRDASVNLDPWLGGLALIAACSPYVGLFGTVWHIIQSLAGIGAGNLNVAAIAKPIGDALYATLWGLGCAIPALIAHRIILMMAPPPSVEPAPSAEQASAATSIAADYYNRVPKED